MKKLNLLKLSLAAVLLSSPVMVNAQQPNMLSFDGNFYADYVGVRLTASSTSGYTKNLAYTITNDGSGATDEWGAAITNQLILDVQKAAPYEACGTLADLTGKLALVKRGNCEFGTKSLNAQNANAAAIIIVNNVGGGPVGMAAGADGAGVNIPVLMISKDDGDAIEAELNNGETVTVTITTWSNNKAHDLGIVNSGISMWHNHAIPAHQMVDASNHVPYNGIDGVVIGNFGSATATGVKLATKLTFTPEGSTTAQLVREDTSDAIASFPAADSIRSLFIDENYSLKNSKEVGRYDITYEIFSDNVDEFPDDNKVTYSFYTTPNIFSKGRYDFQNRKPIIPISWGFAAGANIAEYMNGPMYYNAEGGYKIEAVQVSVSTGSDNNDLSTLGGPISVMIWKWVDGANGHPKDSFMQAGEAEMIADGAYEFRGGADAHPQDTSGNVFTIDILNSTGSSEAVTEDDTWYWVTAFLPATAYLGADGMLNYYVRSFDRFYSSEPSVEFYSVFFGASEDQFKNNPTVVPGMWPTHPFDIDSVEFSQEKRGRVPALPMIVSQFPVSVEEVKTVSADAGLKIYPNPANTQISVKPGFTESGHISFRVVDVAGRVMKVEREEYIKGKVYTISTEDLAPGNYYLSTNVNSQSTFGKFTIVR